MDMQYAIEVTRSNKPPIPLRSVFAEPAQLASKPEPGISESPAIASSAALSETVHAANLSRISARQPSGAQRLLLGLQRQHGNQYVQRVVALARQAKDSKDAEDSFNGIPAVQRVPSDTPAPAAGAAPANAGPAGQGPGAGVCTTQKPAKDGRAIFDNLCLLSDDLTGDARLNDAFHNNPPLTAADNGTVVQKFQNALLDAGEKLPKYGPDGKWGGETTSAVVSFQNKNGVPPGGAEAGRKTLLALDAHLQQNPPKPPNPPNPPPQPAQNATLTAQCGKDQQSGSIAVTGTGFPPGRVDLTVDGAGGNSALADASGVIAGTVSSKLKDGSHVVEATAGGVHGAAQFTTPCGSAPPQPVPANPAVTTAELLVLAKFEFMHETQRDATEDAIKDLQPLDKVEAPLVVQILENVVATYLQFEYGAAEQLVRAAILGGNNPGNADFLKLVDNGVDKAFDFLEDNVKDGLQDAFKHEHDEKSEDLTKHIEPFRRGQLAGLRAQNFKLQQGWIGKMQKDDTQNITPVELQAIGDSVEKSGNNIYKAQYNKVMQAWASYVAQLTLGKGTTQGVVEQFKDPQGKVLEQRTGEIEVTNLFEVGNKDAKNVPGVLLIGIEANDGGKLAADEELSAAADVQFTRQMVATNDIHIFGLSEKTREQVAGPLAGLKLPLVLRGEPTDGGRVAIGKDEASRIVDGGSDGDGKKWLASVSKVLGGSGDSDDGMKRLYDRDFNAASLAPNWIQGP